VNSQCLILCTLSFKTYSRFRLRVDQLDHTPWLATKLVLEAAVMEGGWTFPSLPPTSRTAMEKSASSAIPLWETPVQWYSPLAAFSLPTAPGLEELTAATYPCSDTMVRWCVSYVLNECRKGREVDSAEEWVKYLTDTKPTYPVSAPRNELVIPFSHEPMYSDVNEGKIFLVPANTRQASTKHRHREGASVEVMRSGQRLKITKPSQNLVTPNIATPSARPKYSSTPRPQFRLARSAFPHGTPDHIVEQGRRSFAASVSTASQANYMSAYNHVVRAEALLRRSFSSPPLESEITFFTTYLIGRNISKASVQKYISALRFITLSRGAQSHNPTPALASQLMSGLANIKKNAVLEALKSKRRPITLNMLMLLQNSIAAHPTWSTYEKSMRWTVMLLAYWGSFRMSELLTQERHKFDPASALLPSDLQVKDDCLTVWIRSPKVYNEGGDIVEVWRVEENPNLDPVTAVACFLKHRSGTLGAADDRPVFSHQDGSLYSKAELNSDIKSLLSKYPDLSEPGRETWSGHSFRSGLSTLLTSLGFPEDQIKAWGRWRSAAYLVYCQDKTMRRKTRADLTKVFGKMLSTIC
jgi:hypothetical protein